MVVHGINKRINGCGIMDVLMKPFTVDKYNLGERHARSLDPRHFLQGYNYVGPNTAIKYREQIHADQVLNDLDAAARQHDYNYLREGEEYAQDNDKQKHINNIHRADDIFIEKAKNSRDDPIVGNIASKLIQAKETGEKLGVLPTTKFSGFGMQTDPIERLRLIVKQQYKGGGRKSYRNIISKKRLHRIFEGNHRKK